MDDDEQVMMPWRDDAAASVLSVRVRFTIRDSARERARDLSLNVP